ncbi:MAG: SDR family NAD(P)-dependent oxidoreductase [Candidatus Acidiferrales bacterium]
MDAWRGKWALVTGASSGIGREFAAQLAAGGANLVLTARRRERLEKLAQVLSARHGVLAEVFPADLAQPGAPREIFEFTEGRGITVDLLVNNAGFGAFGEFPKQDVQVLLAMLQVNVNAVLHLTHLYLQGMMARGQGDVLIVSSVAAFQGVPYSSTYAATKAFERIFVEGLAEEMRPHGVRVCALYPGSTTTDFHTTAHQPGHVRGKQEPADKVARTGLAALAAGKSGGVSGARNWLMVEAERFLTRGFITGMAAKMFRPKVEL